MKELVYIKFLHGAWHITPAQQASAIFLERREWHVASYQNQGPSTNPYRPSWLCPNNLESGHQSRFPGGQCTGTPAALTTQQNSIPGLLLRTPGPWSLSTRFRSSSLAICSHISLFSLSPLGFGQ